MYCDVYLQDCAPGFTRVQAGGYLGQCVACNCNGHSNDCDPITGQCLVGNTFMLGTNLKGILLQGNIFIYTLYYFKSSF